MTEIKPVQTARDGLLSIKGNRINSDVLMSGQKELIIIHNNDEYKLRLTGNGKLILTK
jgi:hemin uptake protein HemP